METLSKEQHIALVDVKVELLFLARQFDDARRDQLRAAAALVHTALYGQGDEGDRPDSIDRAQGGAMTHWYDD